MKPTNAILLLLNFMYLVHNVCSRSAYKRPLVIFTTFLDDFGYASASFNRAENESDGVQTPNLDRMAHSGIILKRHYVHSFCSPTRSSFLSGRLPVHVQTNNVQPGARVCACIKHGFCDVFGCI